MALSGLTRRAVICRGPLNTQRSLSANGPDFPGLTRRVMGPVRLRFAARGAPQGDGARVTDNTDKTPRRSGRFVAETFNFAGRMSWRPILLCALFLVVGKGG